MSGDVITIGLYFEIHDADIYGGEGTVGYANINVDLKVSAFEKVSIDEYVEKQKQGVANMCGVDKEKVVIISKSDYIKETEDEDYDVDEDYDDGVW